MRGGGGGGAIADSRVAVAVGIEESMEAVALKWAVMGGPS